jgi:hypothetical protein
LEVMLVILVHHLHHVNQHPRALESRIVCRARIPPSHVGGRSARRNRFVCLTAAGLYGADAAPYPTGYAPSLCFLMISKR